jgi:outer membrane murein-binding lipoprotein Lpp
MVAVAVVVGSWYQAQMQFAEQERRIKDLESQVTVLSASVEGLETQKIQAEAKKIYEAKKQLGFQDYEGDRIADFTPEEQAAMTGIASLVGEGKKYFDPATDLAKGVADKFTAETAQEYMSPYQQAVTDVAKRKAREDFDTTLQDIGLKSALGGGRRGTARAIVEAEGVQDLGQRLSDIQTLGSQSAFQDARRAFEAQKGRERQAGSALAALGQQAPQQALKELTALSGVGEAQRDMTQQGLDLAYQNFLQKQQYPYDVLGQYQSTLYGYPYQAYQTTSGFSKPSSFQNLMGVIGAGKSLFPSFGFKDGGHIAFRSSGGLSGLTANYQEGTGNETVGSKGMTGLKSNLTANLLGSINLGTMSDSLSRLL